MSEEQQPFFTFTVSRRDETGEPVELKREEHTGDDQLSYPPRYASWPLCECPRCRS